MKSKWNIAFEHWSLYLNHFLGADVMLSDISTRADDHIADAHLLLKIFNGCWSAAKVVDIGRQIGCSGTCSTSFVHWEARIWWVWRILCKKLFKKVENLNWFSSHFWEVNLIEFIATTDYLLTINLLIALLVGFCKNRQCLF